MGGGRGEGEEGHPQHAIDQVVFRRLKNDR